MRTGETLASRDQSLRAELGRGGLEVDRDRLGLAEEELYGGVGQRDYRGTTLASRESDRAAGFERERIDLAGEAGEREAFRNQLAEEELYGGLGRRTSVGETFQSQEAGRARTEREERYGVEDKRYEEGTALEARRYATQRGDMRREEARRDEDTKLRRQMEAIGARRQVAEIQRTLPGYELMDDEKAVLDRLLHGGGTPNPMGSYLNEESQIPSGQVGLSSEERIRVQEEIAAEQRRETGEALRREGWRGRNK